MPPTSRHILITGGTGYLGRALIPALLARDHRVRALVRASSRGKLPDGAELALGDPFNTASVGAFLEGIDTVIHLIGVPKPSPAKARQFRTVDLRAAEAIIEAVRVHSRPLHFIYVSVAQPAPVMKSYIAVRREVEQRIHDGRLNATILRPWYVLGPGHRWPLLLQPVYAVLRLFPKTRPTAERLGFITLAEMTTSLVSAVENPPASGVVTLEVPDIKKRQAAQTKGGLHEVGTRSLD
jgi:uncharacterized protein YbjT (DUF2867 family)